MDGWDFLWNATFELEAENIEKEEALNDRWKEKYYNEKYKDNEKRE